MMSRSFGIDVMPRPRRVMIASITPRQLYRVVRDTAAADESGVTFTFKDYRIEGPGRYKTMTVAPGEFIRRFMLHVLPKGFHRIRHYGLLASCRTKAETLTRACELIRAVGAGARPGKA